MYLFKKYKSVITFSFATILLFQPILPVLNLTVQAEEVPLSAPISDIQEDTIDEIKEEVLPIIDGSIVVGHVSVVADYNPYVLGTSFQFSAPVTVSGIDTASLSCFVTKHYDFVNPENSNWVAGTFNGTTCTSPVLQEDNTVMLRMNVKVTNGSDINSYGHMLVRQSDVDAPFLTAFNLDPIDSWTIPSSVSMIITAQDTVSPVVACEGRYNHNGTWSNWIKGIMLSVGMTAECKVNISGLQDGHEYDFQARVLDSVGHWAEGWVLENLVVDGLITDPELDTTNPYINTLLENQTFTEGLLIPDIFVTGSDDTDVDELCFIAKSFNDAPSFWGSNLFGCKKDNIVGNTTFTWNIKDFFASVNWHYFDTTVLIEGKYVFEYYLKDATGNRSSAMEIENEMNLSGLHSNYEVTYNIINVAPTVSLMSDQNINLDQNAVFTGSFEDPSCIHKDGGCYYLGMWGSPDDAAWTTIIDYGDGTEEKLTGNWNLVPGNITIPNHKYLNEGTYTVTLTVCENTNNDENIPVKDVTEGCASRCVSSEEAKLNGKLVVLNQFLNPFSDGECAYDTVTVVVGDSKPTVSITTSPGDSTTLQSITMSAVVVGGNLPNTYSWSGGNFSACTGSATSVVTPATPGTYTCSVQVMDNDGDVSNIATKTVTVNDVPQVPDLNPNVVLFGNSPASNVDGAIQVGIGTPFTITANLSNLGNPNYNFTFGGICTGAAINTTNTALVSDILNLTVGNYVCTVEVSDSDGDVTVASVPVIVGGILGAQTSDDRPNEEEDDDSDEDSNVQGNVVQVCEQKYSVSGSVFIDLDNDGEKDDSEVGSAGVLVQAYFEDGLDEVIIAEETTDANGNYQFELCPGSMNVRINSNDVPDNLEILGSADKDADIIDKDMEGLNFILTEIQPSSSGFNWWVFAILLLIIAGGTGIYLYTGRNQE